MLKRILNTVGSIIDPDPDHSFDDYINLKREDIFRWKSSSNCNIIKRDDAIVNILAPFCKRLIKSCIMNNMEEILITDEWLKDKSDELKLNFHQAKHHIDSFSLEISLYIALNELRIGRSFVDTNRGFVTSIKINLKFANSEEHCKYYIPHHVKLIKKALNN
jgi:hypothetical protein